MNVSVSILGAGEFAATRSEEADGVSYPHDLAAIEADTPEAVATAWESIAVDSPEQRGALASQIDIAFGRLAMLGECPLWSAKTGTLLWIDTDGHTLNRFDPDTGRNAAHGMPDVVGMIAERKDGTLLVAIRCDLATVNDDGEVTRFATAPHEPTGFRLNDGRLDDQGRLWVGLMSNDLEPGTGFLYRYDPDGSWHVMDDGFTLINGLDWNPDHRTLYVTDSRVPAIYAYDHDPLTGVIDNRKVFATFRPADGFPDGLLVDDDGTIWSTLFDGGTIQQIGSDGRFGQRIELPVSRPTSCCFSADRQLLYVTTARLGLAGEQMKREPLAGALLAVQMV